MLLSSDVLAHSDRASGKWRETGIENLNREFSRLQVPALAVQTQYIESQQPQYVDFDFDDLSQVFFKLSLAENGLDIGNVRVTPRGTN